VNRPLLTYNPTLPDGFVGDWQEKSIEQMGFQFIEDQLENTIAAADLHREKIREDIILSLSQNRATRGAWMRWAYDTNSDFQIDTNHYVWLAKSKSFKQNRKIIKHLEVSHKKYSRTIFISKIKIGRMTVALSTAFFSFFTISICLSISSYFVVKGSLDMAAVYLSIMAAFFGYTANERALRELKQHAKSRRSV
jgi:hypothetical protein